MKAAKRFTPGLVAFFVHVSLLLGQTTSTTPDPIYVTADHYCCFLNAVATTDQHQLYDEKMGPAAIMRTGNPGSYVYYSIAKNGDDPMCYVSWNDAARYCNWQENGAPANPTDPEVTERGVYELQGDQLISINNQATHLLFSKENLSMLETASNKNCGISLWGTSASVDSFSKPVLSFQGALIDQVNSDPCLKSSQVGFAAKALGEEYLSKSVPGSFFKNPWIDGAAIAFIVVCGGGYCARDYLFTRQIEQRIECNAVNKKLSTDGDTSSSLSNIRTDQGFESPPLNLSKSEEGLQSLMSTYSPAGPASFFNNVVTDNAATEIEKNTVGLRGVRFAQSEDETKKDETAKETNLVVQRAERAYYRKARELYDEKIESIKNPKTIFDVLYRFLMKKNIVDNNEDKIEENTMEAVLSSLRGTPEQVNFEQALFKRAQAEEMKWVLNDNKSSNSFCDLQKIKGLRNLDAIKKMIRENPEFEDTRSLINNIIAKIIIAHAPSDEAVPAKEERNRIKLLMKQCEELSMKDPNISKDSVYALFADWYQKEHGYKEHGTLDDESLDYHFFGIASRVREAAAQAAEAASKTLYASSSYFRRAVNVSNVYSFVDVLENGSAVLQKCTQIIHDAANYTLEQYLKIFTTGGIAFQRYGSTSPYHIDLTSFKEDNLVQDVAVNFVHGALQKPYFTWRNDVEEEQKVSTDDRKFIENFNWKYQPYVKGLPFQEPRPKQAPAKSIRKKKQPGELEKTIDPEKKILQDAEYNLRYLLVVGEKIHTNVVEFSDSLKKAREFSKRIKQECTAFFVMREKQKEQLKNNFENLQIALNSKAETEAKKQGDDLNWRRKEFQKLERALHEIDLLFNENEEKIKEIETTLGFLSDASLLKEGEYTIEKLRSYIERRQKIQDEVEKIESYLDVNDLHRNMQLAYLEGLDAISSYSNDINILSTSENKWMQKYDPDVFNELELIALEKRLKLNGPEAKRHQKELQAKEEKLITDFRKKHSLEDPLFLFSLQKEIEEASSKLEQESSSLLVRPLENRLKAYNLRIASYQVKQRYELKKKNKEIQKLCDENADLVTYWRVRNSYVAQAERLEKAFLQIKNEVERNYPVSFYQPWLTKCRAVYDEWNLKEKEFSSDLVKEWEEQGIIISPSVPSVSEEASIVNEIFSYFMIPVASFLKRVSVPAWVCRPKRPGVGEALLPEEVRALGYCFSDENGDERNLIPWRRPARIFFRFLVPQLNATDDLSEPGFQNSSKSNIEIYLESLEQGELDDGLIHDRHYF